MSTWKRWFLSDQPSLAAMNLFNTLAPTLLKKFETNVKQRAIEGIYKVMCEEREIYIERASEKESEWEWVREMRMSMSPYLKKRHRFLPLPNEALILTITITSGFHSKLKHIFASIELLICSSVSKHLLPSLDSGHNQIIAYYCKFYSTHTTRPRPISQLVVMQHTSTTLKTNFYICFRKFGIYWWKIFCINFSLMFIILLYHF